MKNFLLVSRSALLTVLVLITVALQGVMGQVASYTFANSSGTYTALSGGTTWQSGVTVSTNLISGDIPIGFTFRYNNKNYTNIRISNNGFIVFGDQSPAIANYTPISQTSNSGTATNGYDGAISGFGCNLLASVGAPTIIYGASGSDFVVQFTQMARSGVTTDRITFQIRLTQTTNVVSIVYGACTGSAGTTIQPQVGLRGASYFDWKNVTLAATTVSNWSSVTSQGTLGTAVSASTVRFTTTTATVVPNSGRTFTWTPPAALSAPTYVTLPATANFDATTWANGNSVQDLPNTSNWRTWPSFGDRSWRRQNVTAGANSGWATVSGVITIAAPASDGAATFNNYDACQTRTGYMDYHVNFSPAGTKALTFDFRNPGTASLRIYLSTDGGATFGAAVATYTATVASWTSQTAVVLGASTSSTVVVRFEATSAYNDVNTNLGIDNVSITNASCGQPSTLSSSSLNYTTATINWVAPSGSPSGYEYEVRTSGAAGSGATGLAASGTTTSAVTANITGLASATAYTYYVRTNCGGTYSSWSSSTFTTLSCNVPTGVGSSAVAATTATISWTAPAVGSPTGYQWEVRSSNAAGSGATGLAASGSTTSPTVTANVTGLTASTAYSIYVRTNCAVGLNSGWTTAATFTTACASISAYPFTETFEAASSSRSCWQVNGYVTGTSNWTYATGAGAGIITTAQGGTVNARFVSVVGVNSPITKLISPIFNLTSLTNPRVRFWYGQEFWSPDQNTTRVYYRISPTDSWVEIANYTGNVSTWTEVILALPNPSATYQIAFEGRNNEGRANVIDNVVVEASPSCIAPTALVSSNIAATSATISWTAASPAPGSGYHYYVSTSATAPTAGTTPTGTTAAGVVTANLTGLTASTQYYYWVRSNCNGVDFSTWAGSSTFYTGYCLVSSTSTLTRITNFSTTLGITNISNLSSGQSAGGYGNFTGLSASQVPSSTVNFTLTHNETFNGAGVSVWINWNNDLDFNDANEQIAVTAGWNYSPFTGTITVPAGTVPGNYRMRIRVDFDNLAVASCGNIATGEAEDYTFSVVAPPTCLAPTALTLGAVTATTATISWTAASPAPGSGYHYYVSTSATAPTAGTTPTGTTAAGVVTANLTGLTANTTYYYWVRSNCDGVDFSTWAGSSTFYTGYCLVSITNSDFTGITNVTFNTINNTSVGDPAVTDFTAVSTTVAQGSAYTLSTRVNTDGNWTVNSKAWIDWNQNTVFDVPSEEYNLGSATNTANGITSLTPSVTVPVGALVGTTYMRVGAVEESNPAPTACGDPLLYGEYEMYTIVVIAGTNCSGAPSAGTAPAATNVCSGGTTTLTVTGATTGSGISYQWEEWNGSAWVSAVGGSGATTTSYTTPALTAGKQYRFTVLCTPSSQSASTTGINITVGTPANDACATAQAITVGAAAITGSVACAAAGSGGCGGSTSDYDVWYSFTVGSTADYKINLLPSANFDGLFQLYNGCGGSLVSSTSSSFGGTTSCIDGFIEGYLEFATYSLTPGTYFVRVYDYNGSGTAYPATSTFTLEVEIPVSACDAPTNIASCGTNINTVIASGAGDWSGYYDCTTLFYDLLGKESVFTYTPTVTSSAYTLTVNSLSPSGTGNYINFLYKASTCSAVGVWNCIDEGNGTGTTLPFSMTAGVTYYFLLKPELTTGYTINWRIDCPPAPPVNDACANATPLPCGTTSLAGTTVASVAETVSIGCTMSQIGVWYSFVGNGFSTTLSSTATFDHEMGIASGSCGALTNIACRDAVFGSFAETHTFTTAVGVTYYVYIAHRGAANTSTGTFTISRTCTVNEWTGNALNTDWATNGNWSTGTAPTSSGTAYIPTSPAGANFPTIDEAAQIATLTLATGATLNIQSGNSMTVTGVLTNSGTISVANGGSLVQGTGSTLAGAGSYNVTRNGSSVYDYWSSPTANVSSGFLGGTVYQYNPASGTSDPSDDEFDPGWVGAGGSMVAAKGYAAYGAGTKTFTGTVNNGDIGIAVTSNASPNVSYNLIGNPYPSGVNVSTFLSTNSALLAVGAVYLWDNPGTTTYVTGDYAVRNALSGTAGGGGNAPTGVLGTAQGFKVNVNGNGTIQFTNAMRTASNTTNIFRQSETQLLWLNAISSDNRFNQTLVGFTEDGTDGNDWAYDAPKLNALGELSLYSYIDGEPLAIQGYGPFEQGRIVPLGLNSDYQTVVTISLDSTENMDVEDIILEDRYYGLFHDLRVSSYVFQSSPMLYSDRFFLHFAPQMVTGVSSNTIAPEMQAYIANDMLNLRSNSRITGTLQMFDMSGKMVLQSSNVILGTELLKVDVSHLAKGVYSVRIQDSKKAYVQKVIK